MLTRERMSGSACTLLYGLMVLLLLLLSACAPSAGILSGSGWQAAGLSHQHIRTLAVDPNDPTKLYAGDEQGKVFASSDGGSRWNERSEGLPLPDPLHMLAFDANGKQLFVATEKGLFVSSDAAKSWQRVNGSGLPADGVSALAFDYSNPRVLYAATATHGVFSSRDGAATWTMSDSGLPTATTIHAITYDTSRHQLWAATASGIYRSDDQGASWHAFDNGLPAGIAVNTVQPASAVGGNGQGLIYAGTARGFFRSQDGGQHWTASQEALGGTSIRCILPDFRNSASSTLYVCTDLGALRSDDSGQTWRSIAPGLPKGQVVYALALGASGYGQIYAAVDDVYLYPGNGGGVSPTRLLPILLVIVFFFALYWIARGGRKRQAEALKSRTPTPPPES